MIRIRGVRKSFESQLVLDGVDLDIPERSVVSIIGPSGSGKSTLLRTIDFLETANAGTQLREDISWVITRWQT